MYAQLAPALNYTLVNEGSDFSDDPNDHGGPTRWGITQDDLIRYLGRFCSAEEVRDMSKETATKVYAWLYWTPMHLFMLTDQNIATAVFDMGVNMGLTRGVKLAQQACSDGGVHLEVDGRLGLKTETALNSISRSLWLPNFHRLVVARYESIIQHNPSQSVFRRGWLTRADRLLGLI